jgi:hypothetical protein
MRVVEVGKKPTGNLRRKKLGNIGYTYYVRNFVQPFWFKNFWFKHVSEADAIAKYADALPAHFLEQFVHFVI